MISDTMVSSESKSPASSLSSWDSLQEGQNLPGQAESACSLARAHDSSRDWIWPSGRIPYYNEDGTLLGRIQTPRSTAKQVPSRPTIRARRAYSKAIFASLPSVADDFEKTPLDSNGNPTDSSWNANHSLYPEEELSRQLMQYNKMFDYLAWLYVNALALKQPIRAEQVVRRGQQVLAALRLLGGRARYDHSPSLGTVPPNSSRVSVWGWKPYREMALAEMVSERRKIRAMEMREQARETKRWSIRSLADKARTEQEKIGAVTEKVASLSDGEPETRGRMRERRSWAEEKQESTRKRLRSKEKFRKKAQIQDANDEDAIPLAESHNVTNQESKLDTTEKTSILDEIYKRPIVSPVRSRREIINWNIPDYANGFDVPTLRLPPPLDNTIVTAQSGGGLNQSHTIQDCADSVSIPYYVRRPPSEPVSPRSLTPTQANNRKLPLPTYGIANAAKVIVTERQREQERPFEYEPNNGPSIGSDSSSRMKRIKSVLKNNVYMPAVRNLPWSSSSSTSPIPMASNNFSPNRPHSKTAESCTSAPSTITQISPTLGHTPRKPAISGSHNSISSFPTNSSGKMVSKITVFSDRTLTSERIVEELSDHASVVSGRQNKKPEGDPLTRTEKEYQEILASLQLMKRELKYERELRRKSRGRRRSRGRQIGDSSQSRSRSRSRSRSQSRSTVTSRAYHESLQPSE